MLAYCVQCSTANTIHETRPIGVREDVVLSIINSHAVLEYLWSISSDEEVESNGRVKAGDLDNGTAGSPVLPLPSWPKADEL